MNSFEKLSKKYINDVNRYPLLKSEQVAELADNWHKTGDRKYVNKIINSNLKFAIDLAYKYKKYNKTLDIDDLVQVANCGLIRAAEKFSSEKKCKFSVYAAYWIKAELNFYLFKNYGIKSQAEMKLFFKDTKLKAISQMKNSEQIEKEIVKWSKKLKIKPEIIKNYIDKRSAIYTSLQEYTTTSNNNMRQKINESDLPNVEPKQEEITLEHEEQENINDALKDAFIALNEREKKILLSKYIDNECHLDIANEHGISRQRVRQITKKALSKLQTVLSEDERIKEYFSS